jgi:tetratricopeptide (TPR) repeat protein
MRLPTLLLLSLLALPTLAVAPGSDLRSARELARGGKLAEAESLLRRLGAEQPQQATVWIELGRVQLRRGNAAGAAESLERARDISPDPAIFPLLGQAYLLLERREEARRALERAVAHDPRDAGSLFNLGRLLRLVGDLEEAGRRLESALALGPEPGLRQRVQSNLGMVYLETRRHARAVPLYEALAREQPERAEWRLSLATALEGLGEPRRALEEARGAARLKPDLTGAHQLIGSLLRTLGDREGALAACRRALEATPEEPGPLALLASILLDAGDTEKALEVARQLVDKHPSHPQGHYLLGQALLLKGEREAAEREFEAHRQLASKRRSFQHTAASLTED